MATILELSGELLEEAGHRIFQKMGLICIYPLNNVPIRNIDPNGPHGASDHLEIDYLIPYHSYCFVGEITARSDTRDVR